MNTPLNIQRENWIPTYNPTEDQCWCLIIGGTTYKTDHINHAYFAGKDEWVLHGPWCDDKYDGTTKFILKGAGCDDVYDVYTILYGEDLPEWFLKWARADAYERGHYAGKEECASIFYSTLTDALVYFKKYNK